MEEINFISCLKGKASEEQWLKVLFSNYQIHEWQSPDFSIIKDRSVYLVKGTNGLSHIPEAFLKRLAASKKKGLIHVGDEFLRGPYPIYKHFDFVIRQYYASFLDYPGVFTLPLGYPNNAVSDFGIPASQRQNIWAFLGNTNSCRLEMLQAFSPVSPHYKLVFDTRKGEKGLERSEYVNVLRNTMFLPCPMGNVMLETWRLYEALELGVIPVLITRRRMHYHEIVMPEHPLPAFPNWHLASAYVKALANDSAALDELQANIREWWTSKKKQLPALVHSIVEDGFNGKFHDSLQSHSSKLEKTWILSMQELAKHHNMKALTGRAQMISSRIVSKLLRRG